MQTNLEAVFSGLQNRLEEGKGGGASLEPSTIRQDSDEHLNPLVALLCEQDSSLDFNTLSYKLC